MNKSLGISVAIFAGTSTLGISSPSALLDWKDPGYFPQIALAFLAETKGNPLPGVRIRMSNGEIAVVPGPETPLRLQYYSPATFPDATPGLTESVSSFQRALSEPFHFSIDSGSYCPILGVPKFDTVVRVRNGSGSRKF